MRINELLNENNFYDQVENYHSWKMHDKETLKNDFKEYKEKEERKWSRRSQTMGFRYPLFKDIEDYKDSLDKSSVITFDDRNWPNINNLSYNYSLDELRNMVSGYNVPRDVDRIIKGFENKKQLPYPVILKGTKGMFIMSGNTRLNVARLMGITPKALLVDISTNSEELNENNSINNINDLIKEFKVQNKDSIEYSKKRGNCGVVAGDFYLFAQKYDFDVERINGYFITDEPVFDKKDFTDEEKKDMIKQGYNFNSKKERKQYANNNNLLDELKKIPHYWNEYKCNIIDFSGKCQFVNSGLSSDTNPWRYVKKH